MTNPSASMISKSQFTKGQQCPKALWYSINRKELLPDTDFAKQALFDAGNEVGDWAKKYFPNGVEITKPYYKVREGAEATASLLAAGNEIIFEATAINPKDGTYSRIDILRKVTDADMFDLIEVKGSTSVKDYHLEDMAFQYRVFAAAGYRINKCFMMLINNDYTRHGDVNPQNLFKLEEITALVQSKQDEVENAVPILKAVLDSKDEPLVTIGSRCSKPFSCDYMAHCWKDVPEYSIYNVFYGKKADEIVGSLGYEIKSLSPEQMPTGAKLKDVNSYISDRVYFEPENIRRFMEGLAYPIYYLDYETIGSAIPIFDGTKPFQNIPFQFSLHIEDSVGAQLRHYEFLHKEQSDPRPKFAEALIQLCGSNGSVIVYNQPFEQGVNDKLIESFPHYAEAITAINNRMVDLLVPFKSRWLYHPKQNGSASIKKVLPAFTDLSYEKLGIDNGQEASQKYLNFIQGKMQPDEVGQLWQDLTEYCGLDTLAMKALIDVLGRYISG